MRKKKYKIVSLFSGAGGMDLGFIQNGFEIIFANDFDNDACKTYEKNIGNHILCEDIYKIKNKDIPKNIDVLIAGFPCQGFSVSNNKRSIDDPRNNLYKEMIRFIKVSKPKVVVAENVKGILSIDNNSVINRIETELTNLKYKTNYKVLNSANYGVPQLRERVFIIANRLNKNNSFPIGKYGNVKKPYITAKQVLNYLSNVPISYTPIKNGKGYIYNHIASTNVLDKFWARKYKVKQEDVCDYLKHYRYKAGISVKSIDKIFGYKHTAGHWFRKDNNSGSIPNPEDWIKLKKILKFDSQFDKSVTTLEERKIVFEQSLRITNWDRPSDTITASQPEIHVNKKRRLSVRECAIIQTFPDDFIFYGSLGSMYRQVGNAVPTLLSRNIAKEVLGLF